MAQNVLIFVPINIGRNLDNLLRKEINGVEFITPKSPGEELTRIQAALAEPASAPDVIISLNPELVKQQDKLRASGDYERINPLNFPLRSEWSEQFSGSGGYLQPLFLAPLIMIANGELSNPPLGWQDLMERFQGRVIAPAANTPATMLFKAVAIKDMKKSDFVAELTCSGLPVDVIMSVNSGLFDVGIIPLPFARYNIAKNARPLYPQEGVLVLPQVGLVKRGAGEQAQATLDYLFGANIQRFFSQLGGMIPLRDGIPIPKEIEKNNAKLYWQGWDWYQSLWA